MAWVRNRRRERTRSGLAAIVALLAVLYAMVVVVRGAAGSVDAAVSSRIDLLAATDPGNAAWGGAQTPTAAPVVPPPGPAAAQPPVAVTGVEGSTPGLYGGSRTARCDVQGFVAALGQSPDRQAAWERAAGAGDGPGSFLGGLTEVVLLRDERVTGWRSGLAPFQGILQRGTAVLVDAYGVPRVRCGGLLPLSPPRPVATTPAYRGLPWAGFDPAATIVVAPGRIVETFTLVDLDTAGAPAISRRPGEGPH